MALKAASNGPQLGSASQPIGDCSPILRTGGASPRCRTWRDVRGVVERRQSLHPSDGLCLAGVAVPPWPLCCTGQPAMLVLLRCWLLRNLDPWQQELSIHFLEHLPAQLGLCFKGGTSHRALLVMMQSYLLAVRRPLCLSATQRLSGVGNAMRSCLT